MISKPNKIQLELNIINKGEYMKLNIIENAMDSLREAIRYYRDGVKYEDERCFKYCVLLLSHSAELCLKEVLLREHKVLIYDNIDDARIEEDRITINFKTALNRIKNICNINLGPYYTYIENLALYRNEIQHYKCEVNYEYCRILLTSSFSAMEYIIINILKQNFNDFEDIISYEDIEYLRKDSCALTQRKKDISKQIKKHSLNRVAFEYEIGKFIYIPCPHCSEKYMVHKSEDGILCEMCGSKFTNLTGVFENDYNCIISKEMKREIGRRRDIFTDVYECEVCDNNTLVHCVNKDEDPDGMYSNEKWICFSCGNILRSITCDDCGDPVPDSEYNYVFAQSYYKAEDYQTLCKKCGDELERSEFGVCYQIS